jgi:hypothetical protein
MHLSQHFLQHAIQRKAGCGEAALREFVARSGWCLPADHVELLKKSNGVTAYGGYFRLLSLGDMSSWNAPGRWKFAWPAHVAEYLCFGETAWGDQYAYRLVDLSRRISSKRT